MSAGLALVAGALEAAVGYPDALYRALGHPVTWIGRLITWADATWNAPGDSAVQRRLQGIMLTLALVAGGLVIGLVISRLCDHLLPWWLAFLLVAALASTLLAQRSLHDHVL